MVRLTRAVALGLLEEDFVQAARARGEGAVPILWHEILPNAWPPIIVECGLRVTFAILLGSALSFLGLGPQPPASEWGLMIAEGRDFLTQAPWVSLAPGLCLCVLLVSVNLVGEGLRERLDPHLSGRAACLTPPCPICRCAPMLHCRSRRCRSPTRRAPAGCRRSMVSRSPFRRAACWGWWANRARASRPSCWPCLACSGASARVQARRLTFDGHDLLRDAPALRGRRIGVVFQDTAAALNPALTIGAQVTEPMRIHLGTERRAAWAARDRASWPRWASPAPPR